MLFSSINYRNRYLITKNSIFKYPIYIILIKDISEGIKYFLIQLSGTLFFRSIRIPLECLSLYIVSGGPSMFSLK